MPSTLQLLQIVVALALVGGLILFMELGVRLGERHSRRRDADKAMETGATQGAMLGLLGLLLGFSFAGAAGRYMERQDLITAEANAIGTAYLRADLLEAPHRAELQRVLREYVAHRIESSASLQLGLQPEVAAEIEALHGRIWSAASAGVQKHLSLAMPVLAPVNEVIDLHSTRAAAAHKHLPGLVLGLLVACSALTMSVIGYTGALSKRRNRMLTCTIALLVAAAIWTTIDLDRPRIGIVQLSDRPLVELVLPPRGE